jgi:biopolymer transport protein ExbB/TolQ
MKNINPLFLLVASFLVFIISIYSYYKVNTNIVFEQNKFKEYQVLAKKYNTLNTTWADISKQKKVLDKLLISSKVKNANIKENKKIIQVDISFDNLKSLNKFTNKLLNTKLNIRKLFLNKHTVKFEVGNR